VADILPITKDGLIARYLFGINLTANGLPYPDEMFQAALETGVAILETELDITLRPVEFYGGEVTDADFATHVNLPQTMRDAQGRYGPERHDWYGPDLWGTLRLRRRPIRRPPSIIHAIYPGNDQPVFTFPESWILLRDPLGGVVDIVAAVGSIPSSLLGSGSSVDWYINARGRSFPGLLRVYYEAGWDAGEIPADLIHAAYLIASFNILNPAGDLILGAGIASTSLSFGGLSQSTNTTSSATNAGFGSRIIQYQKDLKATLPRLKQKYHGLSLGMV